jgi:type I restriction enzyme, R subunit
MTLDFANNNLNGKSKWRAGEFRDYDTSRTRVCVTVGMMTTGYDCEDILNVVLARPIFSATDFIQIKGRGTRLWTFQHDITGRGVAKDGFALFDFFANCEFFEKKFDYDQKLKLPKVVPPPPGPGGEGGNTGGGGGTIPVTYTNTSPDPLKALTNEQVGLDGMKVDREMFRERFATQAQEAAARHPALRDAVAAENWPAAEALATKLLLEKPKDFWNLLKLQQVFRSDRTPAFREILKVIFGILPGVATREQLVQEHFTRFQTTQESDATKVRELGGVFHAYVLDSEVRKLIDAGDFASLRTRDAGVYQSLKAIGPEGLKPLLVYIQANVSLDDLERVA